MSDARSSSDTTTAAEIQSGMDRQKWAENLILQLPDTHEGRNSWLLNYGRGEFAKARREARGLVFNEQSQAVNAPAQSRPVAQAAPERGEPDTDDRRHWIDFVITRWNEMDLPVERRLEEALHSLALARFPDTSLVPSTHRASHTVTSGCADAQGDGTPQVSSTHQAGGK